MNKNDWVLHTGFSTRTNSYHLFLFILAITLLHTSNRSACVLKRHLFHCTNSSGLGRSVLVTAAFDWWQEQGSVLGAGFKITKSRAQLVHCLRSVRVDSPPAFSTPHPIHPRYLLFLLWLQLLLPPAHLRSSSTPFSLLVIGILLLPRIGSILNKLNHSALTILPPGSCHCDSTGSVSAGPMHLRWSAFVVTGVEVLPHPYQPRPVLLRTSIPRPIPVLLRHCIRFAQLESSKRQGERNSAE